MKDFRDKASGGSGINAGGGSKKGKKNSISSNGRPLLDSVLELIWQEKQISRAEISRQTGLSRSTVSGIVGNLLKTGLIAEKGIGESRGGRRPIILEFQDDSRVLLGVDIGATHVSVVLTNMRGGVIAWKEKKHPVRSDPKGTRALIIKLCNACLSKMDSESQQLISIGVALPSPVDPINSEWLSEKVIPVWQGRSDLERLRNRFGVPIYVDNDANLGAIAEHWWGAGKGIDDFVYMKLAYGIGAGYILGGKIYRGAGGIAGELGHMPIDPNGPLCICGLRGCLATFVGAEALEKRVKALLVDYPNSLLAPGNQTVPDIEDAAMAGDKLALQVVHEATESLGIAVTGWLNLMNPRTVILGGSLTRIGDLLLKPLRKKAGTCTLENLATANIVLSKLGPKTIAIGAATLALEKAFEDPRLFCPTLSKEEK